MTKRHIRLWIVLDAKGRPGKVRHWLYGTSRPIVVAFTSKRVARSMASRARKEGLVCKVIEVRGANQ